MSCSLLSHLNGKLYQAEIRGEFAEARRIDREITEHVEKCATCAGVDADSLLGQFFGGRAVVLAPLSQIGLLAERLTVKR